MSTKMLNKLCNMKKLLVLAITTVIFFSCDPVAQIKANIENLTTKSLSMIFISSDSSLSKTLQIDPNQTVLFQ